MEFFRHCPQCRRRFRIKLVSKKLEHVDRESTDAMRVVPMMTIGYSRGVIAPPIPVLKEGVPVIIDVEEFQYAYKCRHCGHEWSEKHVEEHKER